MSCELPISFLIIVWLNYKREKIIYVLSNAFALSDEQISWTVNRSSWEARSVTRSLCAIFPILKDVIIKFIILKITHEIIIGTIDIGVK